MMDQRIIDSNSRDKIIHNTNTNFFVEAGAGSGKTTVLVERMVAMIEEGKNIEHICAITFTKAAANEFYARFQKRLIERSNAKTEDNFVPSPTKLNNPSDLTRSRCLKALNNIDLAFMGTIDSFCNMIMSEHPSLSKIPPNSSLISDEEEDALYLKEYTNILNGFYENKELEEKASLFRSYSNKDSETFITTLKFLLDHRSSNIVVPNNRIISLDLRFKSEKETIIKIVDTLIKHPEIITSKNEEAAETIRKNLIRYRQTLYLSWDTNITGVIYGLKYSIFNKDLRLYLGDKTIEALGPNIKYFKEHLSRNTPKWYEVDDELINILSEIEANKYQVTLDFVNHAKDFILAKLRSEGKLTFSDYLVYLRDTLKDDACNGAKLISHIKQRHKYYMIDEFQDTDPIQSEIFFYLAAQTIDSDWKKCVPEPGSLFIVGDPKQSIYRFKNADVSAFLNIKKMFEDERIGEVLNLYSNFRSTYQIRNWFNDTFKDIMLDSPDQSAYPLIPTDESEIKDDFSGVYSYEVGTKEESEEIAETILKLVNNDKYQIYVKEFIDNKEVLVKRNLTWKDFMLITPTKSKLSNFTSAFRRYKIPYYVEGNIEFIECPALIEIINLYSFIAYHNDNRYLYGALKSKLFNVKENDLISLRENKCYLDIHSEIENINVSVDLRKAFEELNNLVNLSNNLSSSQLFKVMMEELNVFEMVGNKNMEYLYFVFELIKSKENAKEIVNHIECAKYLNNLLENTSKTERCPGLIKDGNQVHLANLHKVKGLEAPIVILASPNRKASPIEFRRDNSSYENLGYVFKISKSGSFGGSIIETNNYDDLKELEQISVEAENLRLAYVGATRARNVLIISSKRLKSGEQSNTNPWKYLLNDRVNDLGILLKDDEVVLNNESTIDLRDIKKEDSIIDDTLNTPSFKCVSPSNISFNYYDSEDDSSIKQDVIYQKEEGSIIGSAVHRLMELIIMSKDKYDKDVVINKVIKEYQNKATNLDIKSILNEVYDKMHDGGYEQSNGLNDDILKEIFEADEVMCEVPFIYKEDNELINGIIDLIYLKDDEYHIIDWKTNSSNMNLDEHYASQLSAYQKAFNKLTHKEVKDSKIYHISCKSI